MTHKHFVIGMRTGLSVEEAADVLACRVFGGKFDRRSSSYFGGEYFFQILPGGEEVTVFRNVDLATGEPEFPEADECPMLVRVDKTSRDVESVMQELHDACSIDARVLELRS